jgi:transposase
MLSTGHGRKNDDTVTALRAVLDHRDDLVKTSTQTVNRLRVVLTNLIPAGAQRNLTADQAAELLPKIRPTRRLRQSSGWPRRRPRY